MESPKTPERQSIESESFKTCKNVLPTPKTRLCLRMTPARASILSGAKPYKEVNSSGKKFNRRKRATPLQNPSNDTMGSNETFIRCEQDLLFERDSLAPSITPATLMEEAPGEQDNCDSDQQPAVKASSISASSLSTSSSLSSTPLPVDKAQAVKSPEKKQKQETTTISTLAKTTATTSKATQEQNLITKRPQPKPMIRSITKDLKPQKPKSLEMKPPAPPKAGNMSMSRRPFVTPMISRHLSDWNTSRNTTRASIRSSFRSSNTSRITRASSFKSTAELEKDYFSSLRSF